MSISYSEKKRRHGCKALLANGEVCGAVTNLAYFPRACDRSGHREQLENK